MDGARDGEVYHSQQDDEDRWYAGQDEQVAQEERKRPWIIGLPYTHSIEYIKSMEHLARVSGVPDELIPEVVPAWLEGLEPFGDDPSGRPPS